MKGLLRGALLASAAAMAISPAFAGTIFDFDVAGMLDEDSEPIPHNGRDGSRLVPDGYSGSPDNDINAAAGVPMRFTVAGLTLSVTGKGTGKNSNTVVFQPIRDDAPREGGLGVMSEGSNSLEQVNSNRSERLILDFSMPVRLSNFNFNSGDHDDCPDSTPTEGRCGNVKISSNAGFLGTFEARDSQVDDPNDPALIDAALASHFATQYTFMAVRPVGFQSATAFYLGGFEAASVIPLPAALPLLGTALAWLGFMGWRQKPSA